PEPGTATKGLDKGWLVNTWFRLKHPDYDKLREFMTFPGEPVKADARGRGPVVSRAVALRDSREPEVVHVLFLETEVVTELVVERDADLFDEAVAIARHAFDVALEQVDRVGTQLHRLELTRLGQRHAVEQTEDVGAHFVAVALGQRLVGQVLHDHGHAVETLPELTRKLAGRLAHLAIELSACHAHRQRILLG